MTGLEPGSPLVETTALPAVPHPVRIFFCEICLFDHTWVFTVYNLHQSNTIICQHKVHY